MLNRQVVFWAIEIQVPVFSYIFIALRRCSINNGRQSNVEKRRLEKGKFRKLVNEETEEMVSICDFQFINIL